MVNIWFLTLLCFYSGFAQEYYDSTSCTSDNVNPGTRYSCNSSFKKSCQTFLVYRASESFSSVSKISSLFDMIPDEDLLTLNNVSSYSERLIPGREVLIPITCSCSGLFFQSNFSYPALENSQNANISDIACRVYEGLVKSITLFDENPPQNSSFKVGFNLNVPLKCSCPDNFSTSVGVKYFVTYPLREGDGINKVSKKFGISAEDILEANHLQSDSTIYPNTTILVPLKSKPNINVNIPDSQPPSPGFLPTTPVEKTTMSGKIKKLYIAGSVIGFFLVLVTLIVCGLYIKALKKSQKQILMIPSTRRSSFNSCSTPQISSPRSGPSPVTRSSHSSLCLSPDLLAGIKYSLFNFSTEEIKKATDDFSQENLLSESAVYKGLIENAQVLIKQMRFDDIRQIIDLHKNINHVNIMKLLGVCYGDQNESTWSYLVFECPTNGSLRSCLANSFSNPLRWIKRTQIAFDIATGLHYLHYSMIPPYVHTGVSSTKIFITPKWRAKLAVSGIAPAVGPTSFSSSNDFESIDLLKALEKEDIFAFGIVLLEIIAGKEDGEGILLKESIGFLGGESSNEGGCFKQLRNFVDPCLRDDYPLAEALCLAVLAKACVEDDPLHRPSMDDIIKVLARMIHKFSGVLLRPSLRNEKIESRADAVSEMNV